MQPSGMAFVARERELDALGELVGASRVVTVWGAGGMGKTRLAAEYVRGAELPSHTVSLAEVTGVEGVLAAIARALGVAPVSARTGSDLARRTGRLLARLGPRILLLDGFEHLADLAGEIVSPLVEAAPELRVVVTSRERLRVSGEATLELGPLSEADAARLFADRLAGSDRSPGTADDVARMLRRLDGIPLAIELCAAAVDDASPPSSASHVPRRLLRAAAAGAAASRTTMRGAIAWSWDLLAPPERDALLGCAVFRGAFSLAAAEQVLDVEPAHERAELVRALREKSLLYVKSDEAGAPRYALFDVVREFVLEELGADAARQAALVARHDAWFIERARELAARVDRTGDIHAREALARELDSLLEVHGRALARAVDGLDASTEAIEILLAADAVLATRSSAKTRLDLWRRACLAMATAPPAAVSAARATGRLGQALAALGELDEAAEKLRAALTGLPAREEDARAELLLDLGVVLHASRDWEGARSAYMTALGDGRAARDQRTMARVSGNLGALHHDEGRADAARRSYERSVELAAAVGDARIEGIMWANLAVLDQEQGQLDGALERYDKALALLEQARDQRLIAITWSNRGLVRLERGDRDGALADHERAVEALRLVGETRSEALAMVRLGVTWTIGGRRDDGARLIDDADVMFAEAADPIGPGVVRVARGFVAWAGGDHAAVDALSAQPTELAAGSDDARTLLRILAAVVAPPPTEESLDPGALVVSDDARAFRPPAAGWVDGTSNVAAQRVLAALVSCHLGDPHDGVDAERLFAAAYPGEDLEPKVARARVYAAIGWLRDHGLAGLLLRTPAGYGFDPSVRSLRGAPPEGVFATRDADRGRSGRRPRG